MQFTHNIFYSILKLFICWIKYIVSQKTKNKKSNANIPMSYYILYHYFCGLIIKWNDGNAIWLQMFALRLKPGKSDEYRKYWNMYHHFLGYALIAVISANIFQGISILRPQNHTWKWAYIGLLGLLLCITLAFEIFTWIKFVNAKKPKKEKTQAEPPTAPNSSQPPNPKTDTNNI